MTRPTTRDIFFSDLEASPSIYGIIENLLSCWMKETIRNAPKTHIDVEKVHSPIVRKLAGEWYTTWMTLISFRHYTYETLYRDIFESYRMFEVVESELDLFEKIDGFETFELIQFLKQFDEFNGCLTSEEMVLFLCQIVLDPADTVNSALWIVDKVKDPYIAQLDERLDELETQIYEEFQDKDIPEYLSDLLQRTRYP